MSDSSDSTISVTNLSLTDLHSESLEACSRGMPPLVVSSSVDEFDSDEGMVQASRDSSLVSSAYTSFSSSHEVYVSPDSVSSHDLYVSPITNMDAQSSSDACLTSSALQQLTDSLAEFTDTDSHDDTYTNPSVTSQSLSSNNSIFHTPDESRQQDSLWSGKRTESSFEDLAQNIPSDVRKDSNSLDDYNKPETLSSEKGLQRSYETHSSHTDIEKDSHTPKEESSSNTFSVNKTFTVDKGKDNLPKDSASEKCSSNFEKHPDMKLRKSSKETNKETSTEPTQGSPRYQKRVNSMGKKNKRYTSDLKEESLKPKDEKHHSQLPEQVHSSVVEEESNTQKLELPESSSISKGLKPDENFNASGTFIYEKPDYILTEMKKGHFYEPTSNPASHHIKHGFQISGNPTLHSSHLGQDQRNTMMNFHKIETDNISDNLSVISEHSEPEDDGNLNDLASHLCPDEDENIDDIADFSLEVLNEVEKPIIRKSPRLERKIKKVKEREAMKKIENPGSTLTLPGLVASGPNSKPDGTDTAIIKDDTNVEEVLKITSVKSDNNIDKDTSGILQARDDDILMMKANSKPGANRGESPSETLLPMSPSSGRTLQSVLAINSDNLFRLSDLNARTEESEESAGNLQETQSLSMDTDCTPNKMNKTNNQASSLAMDKGRENSTLSESVGKTPIPPKRTKNKAVKNMKESTETEIKVTAISSKSDNGSNSPRIIAMTDDCESLNHIKAPVKPPRSFIDETTPRTDYNRTNEEVMARNTTDENTFVEVKAEIKEAFAFNSPSINASVEPGLSDTVKYENKKPASEVNVLSDETEGGSRSDAIKSDSSDSGDKKGSFESGNGKSGYGSRKYFPDISISCPEQQVKSSCRMINRSGDSGLKKKKFFPDIPLLEEDDDVVESVLSSSKRDSGCILDDDVELSRNSLYLSQNKLHSEESMMDTNNEHLMNRTAREDHDLTEQEQTARKSKECENVEARTGFPPLELLEPIFETNTNPDKDEPNMNDSMETIISKTNTSFVNTNIKQSDSSDHLNNVCANDLTKSRSLTGANIGVSNSDRSLVSDDTKIDGTNNRGSTNVEVTNKSDSNVECTYTDGTKYKSTCSDGTNTSVTKSNITNTGDKTNFLTNQVEDESVKKSKTILSSRPSLSSKNSEEILESSECKNKPQDEADAVLARMLMPPPSVIPKSSPTLNTSALPSVIISKSDSPCMHTADSSKLSVNNEGVSDDGGSHGNSSENTPEHRASRQGRLSVPSLVLTADDNGDEDEDNIDDLVASHRSVTSSKSGRGPLSLFSDSRESILSIYSDAGEINYGKIPVSGEVLLGVDYNYKTGALEIYVKQCKDLAPVDTKKNRSDPYVKTYLLPDKTRSGKRKTKIKKHTLNPTFDEVLRYTLSQSEVENRILWLTVWHSDRFGRNDFLGEVMLSLDCYKFGDATPKWYPLQERLEEPQIGSLMPYKGDLILSIKFITPEQLEKESSKKLKTKKNKHKKGAIHVMVKEARNLTAVRANGSSDPFCKGYLLPDKSKSSKQKTPVIKKNCNPAWNHLFIFDEVSLDELPERSLELTIWDHDTLSSNDFLGGIRFNIGTGVCEGKAVDWMDGRGEEIAIWQCMIDRPNTWIDACVNLRASMGKSGIKK